MTVTATRSTRGWPARSRRARKSSGSDVSMSKTTRRRSVVGRAPRYRRGPERGDQIGFVQVPGGLHPHEDIRVAPIGGGGDLVEGDQLVDRLFLAPDLDGEIALELPVGVERRKEPPGFPHENAARVWLP